MYCPRHPKTETALTCTRCTTPVCPHCMVSGPVGFLCPNCGRGGNPLYVISPPRFVLAVIAGIVAGTLAGFLLQAISGMFIWGIFFVAPLIGGLLGEVILRATNRKRGRMVELLAGISVIVGALLSVVVSRTWAMVFHPIELALFVLTIGLTAGAAVGKIRSL